jgi:hypothetical protein
MDVYEIIELADWFNKEHAGLEQAYAPLQAVLRHNASQQERQPIEEHRLNLEKYLKGLNITHFNGDQVSLLKSLQVYSLIGPHAAAAISDRISELAYDPATIANELDNAVNVINNANQRLEVLAGSFRSVGIKFDVPNIPKDYLLMSVRFSGNAKINSLVDFKKQSSDWHLIARGIALAAGNRVEELVLVRATKKSPFVVELAMVADLVNLFAEIVLAISASAYSVLLVRQKARELERDEISSPDIAQAMADLEKKKREEATNHVKAEVEKLFKGSIKEGERSGLSKAIEKFMSFYENGGEVDFKDPNSSNPKENGDQKLPPAIRKAKLVINRYQEVATKVRLLKNKHEDK